MGLSVCRDLGKGLREVRSKLRNRIFRIIFGIDTPYMVLLHAFVKKTQKTPTKDLQLAEKRWKTYFEEQKDTAK
ncbi:type II toxin-antitoxin system RelE/ParE family toxin [Pelagibius sp. Alg239-R121]|uniref:type II toxin-antitoxin system RelE/ParE family toxin n=1 Tax=Pelagibius sp. Alg239-R121 TaxID=2993448 RepID=UPI0024A71C22